MKVYSDNRIEFFRAIEYEKLLNNYLVKKYHVPDLKLDWIVEKEKSEKEAEKRRIEKEEAGRRLYIDSRIEE